MSTDLINLDEILNEPELEPVSSELVKKIYPKKINNETASKCAELMNEALDGLNSVEKVHFRDNMVSMIDCIMPSDRKAPSFKEYVDAVKFVTFKHMGHGDTRAYALTFPDRVQRMVNEKVPQTHLWAYANSYAKNKLVIDIHAKLLVPTHIMYQDVFAQAVKAQVEIMNDNSVSAKVRSDAANSLMTHLKQPEIKKAELQINTKDTGVIGDLANALANLSAGQRQMMMEGKTTLKEINEAVIIEVEPENE